MELAGLLQMPKREKWSLQNFCKDQKGEIGACRTSAKTQKEKSELAELLQTPKREKWSLQERCKHFQKRFGPRMTSVEALCLHRTHVKRKRIPTLGHVRLSNCQLES